jgi:hypothetical protein
VSHESPRIDKTGLNVFLLKPGIVFEELLSRIASPEHPENVFNRKPAASNDRLAPKNLGVHDDSFKQLAFVHGSPRHGLLGE